MNPVRGRGPEVNFMKTMTVAIMSNNNQARAWTTVFAPYL